MGFRKFGFRKFMLLTILSVASFVGGAGMGIFTGRVIFHHQVYAPLAFVSFFCIIYAFTRARKWFK